MQVQSTTSTSKYSITPKGASAKFFGSETTSCQKIVIAPLCINFFDSRNFQKYQRAPTEFFVNVGRRVFDIFFVIHPSVVYRNFRALWLSSANYELLSACFIVRSPKIKTRYFANFQKKRFHHI